MTYGPGDYRNAARIVAGHVAAERDLPRPQGLPLSYGIMEAFVAFFRTSNPSFDAKEFREACVPSSPRRRVATSFDFGPAFPDPRRTRGV